MVGARVVFVAHPTFGLGRAGSGQVGSASVDAHRIGSGAILSAPLEIGEEALIGAGSFVRADVRARTVVVGSPARYLRDVRDDEFPDDRAIAADQPTQARPADQR